MGLPIGGFGAGPRYECNGSAPRIIAIGIYGRPRFVFPSCQTIHLAPMRGRAVVRYREVVENQASTMTLSWETPTIDFVGAAASFRIHAVRP